MAISVQPKVRIFRAGDGTRSRSFGLAAFAVMTAYHEQRRCKAVAALGVPVVETTAARGAIRLAVP